MLTPLGDIAAKTGAAMLMVRHLAKGGSRSALHSGGGSMAIIGAARSALLFSRDPENPDMRALAVTKSNLGPIAPSVRLVLASDDGSPTLRYAGLVVHDADALLGVPGDPERRSAIDEADEFLRDLLAKGPVAANEVINSGAQAGISNATLRRAKARLGITPLKSSFDSGWCWVLPSSGQRHEERAEHVSTFLSDGHLSKSAAAGPAIAAVPVDDVTSADAHADDAGSRAKGVAG